MPASTRARSTVSRRDFARLFAVGGSAALFSSPAWAREAGRAPALPQGVPASEADWAAVRAQFVMPPDLTVMNAANLCPASRPVLEVLTRETRSVDEDPSPMNRARLYPEKEQTRRALAEYLRATPDEIIITRNTSESNNLVSNGLDLGPGDEVIVHADNHPSNLQAWHAKATRYGYTVVVVEQRNPHPGMAYYVDAFTRAMTPRTKVLAFTHLSSTVGDLFPAAELCRVARSRGVLTLVDGAQTFGLLDVDLAAMQPDFYTGSAHKWPCGARECGVLYVRADVQARLWPTIYSAYPGATGFSRSFEGFGQRDEATMIAFREALAFQTTIGRAAIEQRARALAAQLLSGLAGLPGVRVWTTPTPALHAAVVSFVPGTLDAGRLATALYERDRIAITTRGGQDRPGLRVSPHFYNSPAEIDRLLAALGRYLKTGV
ncbi:MAG: aminotransferase class V-fold PLP-dependent enzyme [Vicinamibacterales bacterium]|nr:aminotransferase class V-fold PLP-dependent enzyme [Vicinamibacterales bacterium]